MTSDILEPFNGDPKRAMEFLATALTSLDYRIEELTDSRLIVHGTRTFPIARIPWMSAGTLEIAAADGFLRVRPNWSGIRSRFLWPATAIIFGLILIEVIVLVSPGHNPNGTGPDKAAPFIPLVPLAVMLVVVPAAYHTTVWRAQRAIQTLLHNAAVMATR